MIPGLGRSPGGVSIATYSVFLPKEFPWQKKKKNPHGQRNLVGYNPWGRKESDMMPRDLYPASFLVVAIEICNGKLKLL